MFKQLFLFNSLGDKDAVKHFSDVIISGLAELTGKQISIGKVESSFLLEQKYDYFCEVDFESKDKMNELFSTKIGKQLSKEVANFHKNITIISINYNIK